MLRAAKVLVISRLLHTKLSQRPNSPPYLDSLRNQLGSLRRRLLGRIDRRFKSLDLSRDSLIETMCAFSLATSSSAKDVLRHYHHIRLGAISENIDESTVGHDSILMALRLFVKTLRETQAVIPSQLPHALENLKSIPLFKGPDVYAIVELSLDVHERWIGDDIKTFTPYIRHEDLSKADAERSLKQWAEQAFSSFLDGIRHRIQDVQDPLGLIDLRRRVLGVWLSSHQHSMGIDSAETLDGLRNVFNSQCSLLILSRACTLERTSSVVREILHNWHPGISELAPSLWDSPMTSVEISDGSKTFREILMTRTLGKNEPLSKVSLEYTAFLESIEAVEETIKKLRVTRWDDDIDDVDDADDLLDNKQVLLSEDDPRTLQEKLDGALHDSFANLENTLDKLVPNLGQRYFGQRVVFLIRTWRELRQRLPQSCRNRELGVDSIPRLQQAIADAALRKPLDRCSRRITNTAHFKNLPARPLWEGNPELPILPSPWTFRLLIELVSSMTACGSDIWSPEATCVLKKELIPQIALLLKKPPILPILVQVNGHTNGKSNAVHEKDRKEDGENEESKEQAESEDKVCGEDPKNASDEDAQQPPDQLSTNHANGAPVNGHAGLEVDDKLRDIDIQRLFDVFYLINATGIKNQDPEANELMNVQKALAGDLELGVKSLEQMRKDAGEYWKRTSLLFALLG